MEKRKEICVGMKLKKFEKKNIRKMLVFNVCIIHVERRITTHAANLEKRSKHVLTVFRSHFHAKHDAHTADIPSMYLNTIDNKMGINMCLLSHFWCENLFRSNDSIECHFLTKWIFFLFYSNWYGMQLRQPLYCTRLLSIANYLHLQTRVYGIRW